MANYDEEIYASSEVIEIKIVRLWFKITVGYNVGAATCSRRSRGTAKRLIV